MPSPMELEQWGGAGNLSGAQPGAPQFEARLSYLEALADFIEKQGRLPSEQELPVPFLEDVRQG
jgi:hypothetical protein